MAVPTPTPSPQTTADATPSPHPGLSAVQGSGVVMSRPVPVEAFDAMSVASAFRVVLRPGHAPALTLHADDNVMDLIDAGVQDRRLHIRVREGASVRDATLRAEVWVPALERLDLDGATRVEIDGEISGDVLSATIGGASEVIGAVRVREAGIDVSGASGVELSGAADVAAIRVAGASRCMCEGLQVNELQAEVSGASRVEAWVIRTLVPDLSGASTLLYRGNPAIRDPSVREASTLQSRD